MFKEYKLNKYVSCSAAIAILVTAVSCSSTEDKAKKEAQSIAEQSKGEVKALKDKAMANVDEAASIIVKNIL